jgi:hypothetical protein
MTGPAAGRLSEIVGPLVGPTFPAARERGGEGREARSWRTTEDGSIG